MWYEAEEDVTFTIDYQVDGEFVTPTSASYKLRAHDGTVLDAGTLSVAGTSVEFTILAAQHSIASAWETRYLLVSFVAGGKQYLRTIAYQLGTFVPMTASKDKVRALIGLDGSELPDDDLDLHEAYFELADEYETDFTDAFTAVGTKNRLANQAVALKAALNVIQSVPLRTKIQVRTENTTVARSDKIDFERLAAALENKLHSTLQDLIVTSVVNTALFELSTPTDAITG